jgi:transcriptional regulator with GAF, ATPase, and Fis domain
MIESIKTKLWQLLKRKEVSLAMIFNREGEILWHRGRPIIGKTIEEGRGFSKSCLKQCINSYNVLEEKDVVVVSEVNGLPESASLLNIKSIFILPLSRGFFLYLDSGIKESFSETDREVFKIMGELLGEFIDQIREKQEDMGGISGDSEEIKRIKELVLKYSLEDEPVLLHGETGSGKTHIAELIHRYSGRKGKFITINTPGIPENLFESEVFGHKRGAFTDAVADKKGLVEEAKGGTLFFDEIVDVPSSFQARLLRFIDTRRYFILGSTEERTADVRIVAATNRDLKQAIKKKELREDLYFRLQVLELRIPPLRERRQDIRTLVLEELRNLKGKKIGQGFWEVVEKYDWPGNIRELKSVLKRAGILGGDTIRGQDIQHIINQSSFTGPVDKRSDITVKIRQELESGKNFWEAVKKPFLERNINRDQVKEILRSGLRDAGGRYVDLLPLFNLDPGDYHRFMAFLSDYKLK